MILRYTREQMNQIWTLESRFQNMLEVEVAVAKVQAGLKIIPKEAAEAIEKKAKFSVAKIQKIEEKTKHDVIAFVTNVASNVGEHGKYVHYGLTSSDVLDTALSLQIRKASELLLVAISKLKKELKSKVKEHRKTLCAGRTHGMHAEPTTFGYKMAGHLAELSRNEARLETAMEQISIAKLSGAVGTYSAQSREVEVGVAKLLNLKQETIATQVIPRDRHAQVILSLSMLGAGLERLAIELRHLQRTEVGEVIECFSSGQKGSSAMPHKKNPISSENVTGLARLLRTYAGPALENIALWHERDISHSSVERVVLPDAFILADYCVYRMTTILKGLYVDKKAMQKNMENSQGQLFSSHLLLALIDQGVSREDAYKLVQSASHSLKPSEHLMQKVLKTKTITKHLKQNEIRKIFSGTTHLKSIEKSLDHVMKSL